MKSLICLLIGYVLGSISPAALLSRARGKDLRHCGTGNLGATNTIIVMGKKLGLLVMMLDIFKSYLAAKIAQKLFAKYILSGLLASLGAMIGHTYSMFLHFHGGKGVAAFGGMMLFYKPAFFWLVVIIAIILMLATNLGVAGPVSAAVIFPVLVYVDSGSLSMTAVAAAAGILILINHLENMRKIKNGQEILVNSFLDRVGLSKGKS